LLDAMTEEQVLRVLDSSPDRRDHPVAPGLPAWWTSEFDAALRALDPMVPDWSSAAFPAYARACFTLDVPLEPRPVADDVLRYRQALKRAARRRSA